MIRSDPRQRRNGDGDRVGRLCGTYRSSSCDSTGAGRCTFGVSRSRAPGISSRTGSREWDRHLCFGKPWKRRHSSQHPLAMVRFFLDAAHHGLSESRRLQPLAVENRESFRSLHRFKRIWTLHHSHTLVPPSKTPSPSNKHLNPPRDLDHIYALPPHTSGSCSFLGEQAN